MWCEVLTEYCVSAQQSFHLLDHFLTPPILSQTFCSQSVKTLGGQPCQGAVSDLRLRLQPFEVQTRCVIIWSGCMSWSLRHVFRTFQTLIVNELMSECNQRSFETSIWIISSTKKQKMWMIISGFHVFVIRDLSFNCCLFFFCALLSTSSPAFVLIPFWRLSPGTRPDHSILWKGSHCL